MALYLLDSNPWLGDNVPRGAAWPVVYGGVRRRLRVGPVSLCPLKTTISLDSVSKAPTGEPLRAMGIKMILRHMLDCQRSSLVWHQRLHFAPYALASFSKRFRLDVATRSHGGAVSVIQEKFPAGP